MLQAAKDDTEAGDDAPQNPFYCHTSPGDTLLHCAQVVGFLSDAIPALDNCGMGLNDESSNGIAWILQGLNDALSYEAARVQNKRKRGGEIGT